MSLIVTIDINASNLESSNIDRIDSGVDDATDYSAATTYAEGDKVIYPATTGTDLYESLQGSNANHDPSTETSWWLPLGKVNRWRMFDNHIAGSQSEATNEIEVVIAQASLTNVSLFGLDASTAVVSHLGTDNNILYSTEYDLFDNVSLPVDYYDFFFGLPPEASTQLTVPLQYATAEGEKVKTVIRKTGVVKCGNMKVGYKHYIGITQWEPEIRMLDYSKYSTDGFGRTSLAQGVAAKIIQVSFWVETGSVDYIWSQLERVRGKLSVFDLNTQYSDFYIMEVLGYYRDMYVVMQDINKTYLAMEIVGTT